MEVLLCVIRKIVAKRGLMNHQCGVSRGFNKLYAWSCITGVADFDSRLVLDDDSEGLRAVDHVARVELDNLLGFQVLFELGHYLRLVGEIVLKDVFLFRGLCYEMCTL